MAQSHAPHINTAAGVAAAAAAPAPASTAAAASLDVIYGNVESLVNEIRPAEVVAILQAYAAAHRKHVFLFQRLRANVLRYLKEYTAAELAIICHSFVVVGFLRDDFAASIAPRVTATMHVCTAEQLSLLLDAYASLRCSPPDLLRRMTTETIRRCREFTISQMAIHVSSFARLNSHCSKVFHAVGERLLQLDQALDQYAGDGKAAAIATKYAGAVVEFSARDLTLLAYGFAKLGYHHRPIFTLVSYRGSLVARDFTAHQIQMVVVAYQRAGFRNVEFLNQLSLQAQRRMAQFNAESIALLVRSFSAFGIRDLALFTRIATQLPRLILTFRPVDLATTLNAFARLNIASYALMTIALSHAINEQDKLVPADIQSTLRACARLGVLHLPFIEMLLKRCSPTSLTLSQLTTLSHDLAALSVRDPNFHAELLRHALLAGGGSSSTAMLQAKNATADSVGRATGQPQLLTAAQAASLLADVIALDLLNDPACVKSATALVNRVTDDFEGRLLRDPAALQSLTLALSAARLHLTEKDLAALQLPEREQRRDAGLLSLLPPAAVFLHILLDVTRNADLVAVDCLREQVNIAATVVRATKDDYTQSTCQMTGFDAFDLLQPTSSAWCALAGTPARGAEREALQGLQDIAAGLMRQFSIAGLVLYHRDSELEDRKSFLTPAAVTTGGQQLAGTSKPTEGASCACCRQICGRLCDGRTMAAASPMTPLPLSPPQQQPASSAVHKSGRKQQPPYDGDFSSLHMPEPPMFLPMRSIKCSLFSRSPWHTFLSLPLTALGPLSTTSSRRTSQASSSECWPLRRTQSDRGPIRNSYSTDGRTTDAGEESSAVSASELQEQPAGEAEAAATYVHTNFHQGWDAAHLRLPPHARDDLLEQHRNHRCAGANSRDACCCCCDGHHHQHDCQCDERNDERYGYSGYCSGDLTDGDDGCEAHCCNSGNQQESALLLPIPYDMSKPRLVIIWASPHHFLHSADMVRRLELAHLGACHVIRHKQSAAGILAGDDSVGVLPGNNVSDAEGLVRALFLAVECRKLLSPLALLQLEVFRRVSPPGTRFFIIPSYAWAALPSPEAQEDFLYEGLTALGCCCVDWRKPPLIMNSFPSVAAAAAVTTITPSVPPQQLY